MLGFRMTPELLCQLASRLMHHPAAPYNEHAVRSEVELICTEHGLEFERDRFGNVLARLRTKLNCRPIALAAHLDHPGFELIRKTSGKSWEARFRGGVQNSYFRRGVPVVLMPGRTQAKVLRTVNPQTKVYEIRADERPAEKPGFAVWALDDFAVRAGKIHARACDDLIGVATALAVLIELKRTRARVHVLGVFSRAEEVGFQGALALAASRRLPQDTLLISLETSRELPGVKMGAGVILRVGDRASIFDSKATRYLAEVAAELSGRNPEFLAQRGLMAGGTCEATAYQEYGFQSAAVCVALGNYHNCGEQNTIRSEYVSVGDVCKMVELLVEAARSMTHYGRLTARLPQRLKKLLWSGETRLRNTAG